jgi:hypothetical protein
MPYDPEILDMDPVLKSWMFENWQADQEEEAELAKNTALLLASFWNPEAVRQMTDEAQSFHSTDESFDDSSRLVREMNLKMLQQGKTEEPISRRRRRRHLKD